MGKFTGTVTLITGASSGIGAALALEIAKQGGDLVIVARRQERIRALAAEIEGFGRQALAIGCDVTLGSDLDETVKKSVEVFGKLDNVVANAGFGVAGRADRLTMEDYRRQFETNVFGVLKTFHSAVGQLASSRGCFVIVGSINGFIALPGLSAYSMSKFAVHALADSLYHELKPLGIAVVLIAPGFVRTEIRKVNSRGVFNPEARDGVPGWLQMPAENAARQIAQAIYKRQRLRIITGHGQVAVFIQRHFPKIVSLFISRSHGSGRK